MKRSMTLIEVLIALFLIVIVMTSHIDIQNKSIFFFKKLQNSSRTVNLCSFALYKKKDENIYLSDIVDFKDDEVNRDLKSSNLKINNTHIQNNTKTINNIPVNIITIQKEIILNDNSSKNYYSFNIK